MEWHVFIGVYMCLGHKTYTMLITNDYVKALQSITTCSHPLLAACLERFTVNLFWHTNDTSYETSIKAVVCIVIGR